MTLDRDASYRDNRLVRTLPYAAPYDWDAMLAFLAARAIPGVEAVADSRYLRSISLDGQRGWIEVACKPHRDALLATIRFPNLTALPAIVARIRRVFDLTADVTAIGANLATDPTLARLVAARPGLRVPGAWDGFELAVRAILGQQITVAGASKLAGRIVEAHGDELDLAHAPASLTHVFPSAGKLADIDLAPIGMPRARAAALSALAATVVADPRLFDLGGDLDDAIARLRRVPGIGEWTAQYIAMRALREPDAFPTADIGLLRALEDSSGRRPAPAELLAKAEAWRPWRAYAAIHLWASLADKSKPRAAVLERRQLSEKVVPAD
jgi:AraC family transcriptional regulator of adaptative response / DNA-3-methyladenine glycosylase II